MSQLPVTSQIKQQLFDILVDKTTLHGIPRIFLAKCTISKIFWLVATLLGFGYCSFLVTESILQFFKYEVITKYENVYEDKPLFPQVLFCDHDINTTECIFEKSKCPELYRTSIPRSECQGFNENRKAALSSREYGYDSGLQLKFNASDGAKGIRVVIANHSNEILTDPRHISPGMRTTFVIKRVFEHRLPAPYSDCRTNETFYSKSKNETRLEKAYYQSECHRFCLYQLIAEKCNMSHEFSKFSVYFYYKLHSDFVPTFNKTIRKACDPSKVKEAENEYKDKGANKACHNLCPVECNGFSLLISSFYFKLPNDAAPSYSELEIFYESFDYTVISQIPKTSWDEVLGTIGGLVGLFLGASVLSLGEFIELLLSVIQILLTSRNVTVVKGDMLEAKKKRKLKKRISPPMVTKLKMYGILTNLNRQKANLYKVTTDE